jgi:integrase
VPSGSATSPSITSKPKTRAGEGRPVDIDADSVKALAAWRAQQQKEAEEWGDSYINLADDDGAYNVIFNRENGEPLNPHRAYSMFVGLVKEAGLSHLKLHGLRHINISHQLDAGVSETAIAARAKKRRGEGATGRDQLPEAS